MHTVLRENSAQTMSTIRVTDELGQNRQAVSVSCHIRPDKGVSISVDVLDRAAITDETRGSVASEVGAFIAEELGNAAELGVPVRLPTGE